MGETKVVLVTGAARRIGASIARRFHDRGFTVLIHYNHSRGAALALEQELNADRPQSAKILRADFTSEVDVERLGVEALDAFGRLDVLVNNASSFYPTRFGTAMMQQWEGLMDSNLRAAFFLAQALSAEIRLRRGAIVNVVDTHADRPLAGFPVYSIAKAGLKAMTKALATELAPEVRVNGVSPGAIHWPPSLANDNEPSVQYKRQAVLDSILLGKLGDTRDIADATTFLALDATYVTGQVIKIDGGRSIT